RTVKPCAADRPEHDAGDHPGSTRGHDADPGGASSRLGSKITAAVTARPRRLCTLVDSSPDDQQCHGGRDEGVADRDEPASLVLGNLVSTLPEVILALQAL